MIVLPELADIAIHMCSSDRTLKRTYHVIAKWADGTISEADGWTRDEAVVAAIEQRRRQG